ncbi:hypothetical protein A3A66_04790 [Microgenomates group bacterium RIFCSPLOWO2_01_FULL_46_13]|nr:MAG: hypothetical protein A2783_00250 [Microgenomates group bacterium RIFCSPHIGHO2_01_FULL_45_11]OGV94283.1 MAG: hypothetical protein A3A66_04790 [Microgenomates group bacterium RIFCSPLOWO2_01_FULL_46_13]
MSPSNHAGKPEMASAIAIPVEKVIDNNGKTVQLEYLVGFSNTDIVPHVIENLTEDISSTYGVAADRLCISINDVSPERGGRSYGPPQWQEGGWQPSGSAWRARVENDPATG